MTKLIIVLREELELEVVGADGFDEEEDTLLSPQGLGEELDRLRGGVGELEEDLSVGVSDQPRVDLDAEAEENPRFRERFDPFLDGFLREGAHLGELTVGEATVAVEVEKEGFLPGAELSAVEVTAEDHGRRRRLLVPEEAERQVLHTGAQGEVFLVEVTSKLGHDSIVDAFEGEHVVGPDDKLQIEVSREEGQPRDLGNGLKSLYQLHLRGVVQGTVLDEDPVVGLPQQGDVRYGLVPSDHPPVLHLFDPIADNLLGEAAEFGQVGEVHPRVQAQVVENLSVFGGEGEEIADLPAEMRPPLLVY